LDASLLFSEENRRNPYPIYAQMRAFSPVLKVPPPFDAWLLFDYDSVKRALTDHETFSSRVPAPQWFIFSDPPAHTKLRGLIAKAFTPGTVAGLEPAFVRFRGISWRTCRNRANSIWRLTIPSPWR
jgi:cytochrome P450